MELREYFRIIGKYKFAFWAVIIVLTLGAFLFTKMQHKSYLASTTITVNKASAMKQSQVNYYLYDNYYNVQSSSLFSMIVTSWFDSPSLIKEIYTKGGVHLPDISQKKLSKTFKAARVEPATIHLSLTGSDQDDIGKLIKSATSVVQDKTNELGRSDRENVYDIVTFDPIVSETTPNLLLNTLIGLIAGVLIGAVATLVIEYFKVEKKS